VITADGSRRVDPIMLDGKAVLIVTDPRGPGNVFIAKIRLKVDEDNLLTTEVMDQLKEAGVDLMTLEGG
jgi:hypothetical protein